MIATTIPSVERGIIFLMVQWSGAAQWAHRWLMAFLKQRGVPTEHLLTIDVDRETEVFAMPEFTCKIHGWGEAAVVRNGRIVFVTVLGKDQSRVQEDCEELMRVYEGYPVRSSERAGYAPE